VRNWATVAHWSLFQSRCQRWNLDALPVNTLWTLACGSLRYLYQRRSVDAVVLGLELSVDLGQSLAQAVSAR